MQKITHGSLFSGIGGFDLAAEWAGWENVLHCEWNEFGKRVLNYYWPNAKSYDDITKTDFTIHRNTIDVLSGGFPCQPYSAAGKRLGKDDSRHLWPEMLRAIREIQPSYVVGENVRGLTNWNGGMVFDEVQADLEAEGYEVLPFLLPACAVNAPHRRDRIWFVAYSDKCNDRRTSRQNAGESGEERIQKRDTVRQSTEPSEVQRTVVNSKCKSNGKHNARTSNGTGLQMDRNELCETERNESTNNLKPSGIEIAADTNNPRSNDGMRINENGQKENNEWKGQPQPKFGKNGNDGDAANTNSTMRKGRESRNQAQERPQSFNKQLGRCRKFYRTNWKQFPSQSPVRNGNDGISDRLDGITFPKWRNESIKAGGNAIVPQVAYEIFKVIDLHLNENN